MSVTTIICRGYRNEYSKSIDPKRECTYHPECPLVKYHKGQHWTDDWIKCTCPFNVFPKDKIRITNTQVNGNNYFKRIYEVKKVRKYTRKMPKKGKGDE